jgi:hypothetical protein
MSESERITVNKRTLEVMKVWYATFTTIMDSYSGDELLWRLRKLRDKLKQEAPELEVN